MTGETNHDKFVRRTITLMDVIRQVESDRDAYAAVAKAAMEYIECSREDCWACKGRIAPALDALTDEQKERIT